MFHQRAVIFVTTEGSDRASCLAGAPSQLPFGRPLHSLRVARYLPHLIAAAAAATPGARGPPTSRMSSPPPRRLAPPAPGPPIAAARRRPPAERRRADRRKMNRAACGPSDMPRFSSVERPPAPCRPTASGDRSS